MLRRQEFVELARQRDLHTAIAYAKRHLVAFADEHERQLQQTMALIAISPSTLTEPYRTLYDESQWRTITTQFRSDNYALHCMPAVCQLVSTVQAGLAALKTPQCAAGENTDCPACMPPLNHVAATLPSSHHENSTIVCRITGAVMDEDNPPTVLPNGTVYSRRACEEMMAKYGSIKCFRTGQVFFLKDLKKCFIL